MSEVQTFQLATWVVGLAIVALLAIAALSPRGRWFALGVLLIGFIAFAMGCTKPGIVTKTKTVEVKVPVYVRIPEKLTAPVPKAEGPLNQVIDVAKKRGEAIEACNGKLAEIAGIEGTKPC